MKILAPIEPQDTMLASMAYPFWYIVAPIVFLTGKKEEPFVKFHTMQATAFGIALTAFLFFCTLITALIFRTAPSYRNVIGNPAGTWSFEASMGWSMFYMLVFLVLCLLFTVAFGLIMYYAAKTWNGAYFTIPVIGKWLENKYFYMFRD